ncbi:MAG: UUP1 family membrane protein, partial [Haliea sp.]|nr:UUP1 family membrane protein [Haliea sp.]
MIASSAKVGIIAGVLIVFGVAVAAYKVVGLDLPLWPGESREVWTVETKVSFKPADGPVEVDLALPSGLG